MTWRQETEISRTLGRVFRQHTEQVLPELTKKDAAARADVSLSVYNNILKGLEVGERSYRKAAKGLGLPGGIPRVDAILSGRPDPGPVADLFSFPKAAHAAATEDEARDARIQEALMLIAGQLDEQGSQIADLASRISALEAQKSRPAPRQRPKKSG